MGIDKKQLKKVLEYASFKIYCDIEKKEKEIKEENEFLNDMVDDGSFETYLHKLEKQLLGLEELKKNTQNMLYEIYKDDIE